MGAVTQLDISFNIAKLLSDYQKVCETARPKFSQISLTHSGTHTTPQGQFEDGVGSLKDYDGDRNTEEKFAILNDLLKGSYTERVYKQISKLALPKRLGRVRYMIMEPKTCYTLHMDADEYRYHIPLITNDKCFFVSEKKPGVFNLPEKMVIPGTLYLFKTNQMHTAVNASFYTRVHLVFSTYDV